MNKENKEQGSWFLSALLLLFIALKLTGYIDWSWWWVLSPIWLPFVTLFPILVLILYRQKKREKRMYREFMDKVTKNKQ